MLRHRREKGFSIIELVLVVAMIGIISTIIVPYLIDAIHRAKQRRTMGELALVGSAWMNWLTDQSGSASAGQTKIFDRSTLADVTYPELFGYLHPSDSFFYMQSVPEYDAWGSRILYWKNPNLRADRLLGICAAARGDVFETCKDKTFPIGPFLSTDFDSDIVWADGAMIRWPEARGRPGL